MSSNSDEVTLPAGIYIVFAQSALHRASRNLLRLYNVTDSVYTSSSLSSFSNPADSASTPATFKAYFSIASAKVFSLSHNIEFAVTGSGLGIAANRGATEVYSQFIIEKIG